MHQYKILVGIDNPQILFNGNGTTPELRPGVRGGLGLINLQLPCKEFSINWQDRQPAELPVPITPVKSAPECYGIVYRISNRVEDIESAIKTAGNVVGIFIESPENNCLEAIANLQKKYPHQVKAVRDFNDAAIKLVCHYEYNKGRKLA
jgi:hypothetical protein